MTQTRKVLLAMLALYLFWGTEYYAIKIGIRHLPPFLLAGLYSFLGGFILLIYTLAKKQMKPTRQDIKNAFLSGLFFVFASAGLLPLATVYIDSGLVAILSGLSPLIAVLLNWLVLKSARPSAFTVTGIVLGFAGLAVTTIPALGSEAQISIKGINFAVLSAVFWAVGMVLTKNASFTINIPARNSLLLMFGGSCLLVSALVMGEFRAASTENLINAAPALIYIIFASSLISYYCYLFVLQKAALMVAGSTAYVCPVVAVIVGSGIGGERLSLYTGIAVALILLSLVFISRSK